MRYVPHFHPAPGLGVRTAEEEEAAWMRTLARLHWVAMKYGTAHARTNAMNRQAVRRLTLCIDAELLARAQGTLAPGAVA